VQAVELDGVFCSRMLGVTQHCFELITGIPVRKSGERFIFSVYDCLYTPSLREEVYALVLYFDVKVTPLSGFKFF